MTATVRPRLAFRCWVWCVLTLGSLTPTGIARAEDRTFGWAIPPLVRVMTWGTKPTFRDVDSAEFVDVPPGDFAIVPVGLGDRFRVRGGATRLGFGSGDGVLPDAVTWLSDLSEEVYVPPWRNATSLVIAGSGRIEIRLAAKAVDPMRWHRFDAAVHDHLIQGAPLPDSPSEEGSEILREMDALAATLPATSPGERTKRLFRYWLDGSYRIRPFSFPFFTFEPIAWTGGKETSDVPTEEPRATPWRMGKPGEQLIAQSTGEVIRLGVRVRRTGTAKVRIFQGDELVRELEWKTTTRRSDASLWSDPEWVRLVLPPADRRAQVEILAGEVSAAAVALSPRTDLLDARARIHFRSSWKPEGDDLTAALHAPKKELAEARALVALQELAGRSAILVSPLVRRILEHLVALRVTWTKPPPLPVGYELTPERDPVDALLALLVRAPEGTPNWDWILSSDDFAKTHLAVRTNVQRAHRMWRELTDWTTLAPLEPLPVVVSERVVDANEAAGGMCSARGPSGLRWTRIGHESAKVAVDAPDGWRARVLLRPSGAETPLETTLQIDGTSMFVHGAAGLGSLAAVSAGVHAFHVEPGGAPILARVPRSDLVPCGNLRELERWLRLERAGVFSLAKAEGAKVLSLSARAVGASRTSIVRVHVGASVTEGWFRAGAPGSMEWRIPEGVTFVRVETSEPIEMRLSARVAKREAHTSSPIVPTPVFGVEALLSEVRTATRTLHTGEFDAREQARKNRARALHALGFTALAALDVGRIPDADSEDGEDEIVPPSLEGKAVEPLGLLSRISPLPDFADPALLADARKLFLAHEYASLVERIGDASKEAPLLSLLLGMSAEALRDVGVAGAAFERVGMGDPFGVPLGHAATLVARRAKETSSTEETLRAYVLAELGAARGDIASGARGLLSPVIRWQVPTRVDGGAGFRDVDYRAPDPEPLGTLVHRAWLDAPDGSILLREGESVETTLDARTSEEGRARGRCSFTDGSTDPCSVSFWSGGSPISCTGGVTSDGCTFRLPPGRHRLSARLPEGRPASGWITWEVSGKRLEFHVVSQTIELDSGRPAAIDFRAPTVVRVAVVRAGEANSFSVRVERKNGSLLEEHVVSLGEAKSTSGTGPLQKTSRMDFVERELAILERGTFRLRLSSEGTVYARIRVATAVRPIDMPLVPPTVSPGDEDATALPDTLKTAPPVTEDPAATPITVGATVSASTLMQFRSRPKNEYDAVGEWLPTPVVESRARLQREVAKSIWFAGAGVARVREGPDSWGFNATLDTLPKGWIPGTYAGGLIMFQDGPSGLAYGGHALFEAYSAVPLTSRSWFSPLVAATFYRTDRSMKPLQGRDADIFSDYPDRAPWFVSAAARWNWRPLVDTIVRAQAGARMVNSGELDRVEARIDADALPGRGWAPWVGATVMSSGRFVNEVRSSGFLRHSLQARTTLWKWVADGHRISFSANALLFIDFPAVNISGPVLSVFAGLNYDFSAASGLRDFPRRLIPFRDRMEEDSGRIRRFEAEPPAAWVEP